MIEACIKEDPNKRPSFDEIVEQLKNDQAFITNTINEDEYRKYISYINCRIQSNIKKEETKPTPKFEDNFRSLKEETKIEEEEEQEEENDEEEEDDDEYEESNENYYNDEFIDIDVNPKINLSLYNKKRCICQGSYG